MMEGDFHTRSQKQYVRLNYAKIPHISLARHERL